MSKIDVVFTYLDDLYAYQQWAYRQQQQGRPVDLVKLQDAEYITSRLLRLIVDQLEPVNHKLAT